MLVAMPENPPVAPRRPHRREHHGHVVTDEYAWMRDKTDPEFLAYLQAENAYTEALTAGLSSLRESIFSDIAVRTQQTDLSVPDHHRHSDGTAYWYYLRTTEGRDYPSYHRAPAADPDAVPDPDNPPVGEELLLDIEDLARGHDFLTLGVFDVSPDGTRLAYSVDTSGDERYRLCFLDLSTGELLPDQIEGVAGGGCWSGDDLFCYCTVDDAWRPDRVWRHRLGTAGDDELLWHEPDDRFWLGVEESRDRRWLVIAAGSKTTSEVALLPADGSGGRPRIVAPRRDGVEYDVEVAGDRLFIVHNDGALDFALAEAPLTASGAQDWTPVWPGEPGVRLLGVSAYDRGLVLSLRRDGLATVEVWPFDQAGRPKPGPAVSLGDPLAHLEADGGEQPDTDRIRLRHQSLAHPPRVLEYRLDTGAIRTLRQLPVLDHPVHGPYRADDYVERRDWAVADDGTRIPLSIIHRADVSLDGSAPALLYGYGAYEISLAPHFSIARLSLLDQGFVYAIAHVRGGGELGRAWYEAGRLAAKETTFTDFISCARHLVSAGYTRPDRLAAEGGSAGGLLIGAVVNLAPDAFAAIHAAVPFVDALTTILDPDLPLTVVEWEEWGDPLHDPEAYDRMAAYSPYDNVGAHAYPSILVTASLNDTRVEITEPAKWVARLRATARTTRPILLRVELDAGHGGVSGRYRAWRDAAFELAWIIDQTRPQPLVRVAGQQPQSPDG